MKCFWGCGKKRKEKKRKDGFAGSAPGNVSRTWCHLSCIWAVEKVGNALDSPMPTRGILRHEACFLSSLCGQAMRSHAPKSLGPGHPSGFHHVSSIETFYSRHLVSSLQIPQKTASACPTSLRPFLTITALDSSCPWETCSDSASLEAE